MGRGREQGRKDENERTSGEQETGDQRFMPQTQESKGGCGHGGSEWV